MILYVCPVPNAQSPKFVIATSQTRAPLSKKTMVVIFLLYCGTYQTKRVQMDAKYLNLKF